MKTQPRYDLRKLARFHLLVALCILGMGLATSAGGDEQASGETPKAETAELDIPTPSFAQDLPEPLARFQFDGSAKDSTGNKGNKLIMDNFAYPTFRGNALYGNGVYGGFPEQSPAIKTASLDFKAFTIALRFKAMSFKKNNIIAGGRKSRWMSFRISNPSRNLTVTFNDQDFEHEYPVELEKGKWYSLVSGVNLQSRTVTTYLNGKLLPSIRLPQDFRLRILERTDEYQAKEKRWYLANYSNGETFHGLVDELAVFDGDVSPKVAKDYLVDPLLIEILRSPRTVDQTGALGGTPGDHNHRLQRNLHLLETRLKEEGIQTTQEGVIRFLTQMESGENRETTIAGLIRQLGDDSFQMREAAGRRLRDLGFRARKALEAAKSSQDANIAYRSRRLLDQMDVQAPRTPLIISALDYLRARPSPEAVPCLFTTLTESRSLREFARICAALQNCARPENRGLVTEALASKNLRVRFAAVVASERVFEPAIRRRILEPYFSDEDGLVRIAAASSLLPEQRDEALEVLEGLRDSPSFAIRYLVSSLTEE